VGELSQRGTDAGRRGGVTRVQLAGVLRQRGDGLLQGEGPESVTERGADRGRGLNRGERQGGGRGGGRGGRRR